MRTLLLVAGTVLLTACPPGPVNPQPDADAASDADAAADDASDASNEASPRPPPPITDAAPPDAVSPPPPPPPTPMDDCGLAEAVITKLGCKDNRGQLLAVNKKGRPFAETCRNAADAGVSVRPDCIKTQTTCAGVLSCGIK